MEIELLQGSTKAIIDPQGAWLTNLSNDRGDILFPKRHIQAIDGSKKTRGGLHVCLPQFGPGGESGLPQHGFGREMLWTVERKDDHAVTLVLARGKAGYETMQSRLTYTIGQGSVSTELELHNQGSDNLRVAPAFHPYFMTFGGSVILNDELQDLNDLAVAQFIEGESHKLQVGDRTIRLTSDGLPTWATWTDQLGEYVCIEPTLDGFSFNRGTVGPQELLVPGEKRAYSFTAKWS